MTPLRKEILALARKFDGVLLTEMQAMMLRSTMASMDDTLSDSEVMMFLRSIGSEAENAITITAKKPAKSLVAVAVSEEGKVTVHKAPPFSNS